MADPHIRKREADGNPTSLRTVSNLIENIENPRTRYGTYKGYAILTFQTPKAAQLAVEALNHEGHFRAKIDKDQLPPYSEPVIRTVYIGQIPPFYSRYFFSRLIEDCIPRSFIIHFELF